MRELTDREQRLIALGLLILAIGLGWLLIAGPLVGGFVDRAAERRDEREAYQRNARLIASLPAIRAAFEAQTKSAARFGVTAPTQALAAEALQERLQRLSADQGFTVRAVEDLQADAPPGWIKLRADLTATLTQLCATLRRLQSEDAYVDIDDFSVSADRSFAAGKLRPLDVRLELSTPWRAGRAQP
jgi:general secretion pathway protein M